VVLALIYTTNRTRFRNLYLLILPLALLQSAYAAAPRWEQHLSYLHFTKATLVPVSTWLRNNVDAEAAVLVHDIGFVSFATEARLIDLVGLKTPSSVEAHLRSTLPSCGTERHRAVRAIASAAGAEYAVILNEWDRIFDLSAGLPGAELAWRSPQRERHYSIYRLSRTAVMADSLAEQN
jgi:hypothetical protein